MQSDSFKKNIELLKDLQGIDLEIISINKEIENFQKMLEFLENKINRCDVVFEEINNANALDKIAIQNIIAILEKNDLFNDLELNEEDSIDAAMEKISSLKTILQSKLDEKQKDDNIGNSKKLKELNNKKDKISKDIDKKILLIYDRLFNTFDDHIVVSSVENQICMHCHIEVYLQKYMDILKFNDLTFCENCGRILTN